MQNPPKRKKERKKERKISHIQNDREAATRWTSTRLGKTETPLLEGTHKKCFACTRTQGKGAVTPKETELDLFRVIGKARITTIL